MGKNRDKYGDNRPLQHNNQAVFAYSGATPVRGRARSGRKMSRFIVGMGFTLAAVGSMVLVSGTVYSIQNNKKLDDQLSITYNPMYKVKYPDLGGRIVTNWFQGKEAPVSYSDSISWPTSTAQPSLVPFQSSETSPLIRDVTFIGGTQMESKLSDKQKRDLHPDFKNSVTEALSYYAVYNGVPYNISLSLLVAQDSDQMPILLTPPTLEPVGQVDASVVNSNPEGMGLNKVKLPNVALDSIQTWSAAWASNDSSAIKQMTKDSSDNVYRGLGGWSVDNPPKVNWSYEVIASGKRYVAAQVEFDMYQYVKPPASEGEDNPQPIQFTVRQVQDILLSDVESGLPAVIAWGPAGTWSTLEPLMNALPAKSEIGDKADGRAFMGDGGSTAQPNVTDQPSDAEQLQDDIISPEETKPTDAGNAPPGVKRVETEGSDH